MAVAFSSSPLPGARGRHPPLAAARRVFAPGRGAALAVALLLASCVAANAQTSYSENFDGPGLPPRWNSDSHYSLAWDAGTLRITMNKNDRWQGLYFDLGGTFNFAANPVVSLSVRGDVPFLLHVYFVDANNKNILVSKRVHEVGRMHDFCFDLAAASQPTGFNMAAIKALIFTPNGAGKALAGTAWFDNLRVGDTAARFAGMRAVPDQHRYRGTAGHSFLVTDIANASSLSLSPPTLLANVALAPIAAGQALLTYDCAAATSGSETLTLTARGTGGFADRAQTFQVVVHDNAPPTVDPVARQSVQVGATHVIRLAGLSDGDATADQPLSFLLHSADQTALPDGAMRVVHTAGSRYADLYLTAAAPAAGIGVTLALDDGQATDNRATLSFAVDAYNRLNRGPTLDAIADQTVQLTGAGHRLQLAGIGDGDGGGQALLIAVASSNEAVLKAANIGVGPIAGGAATLSFLPAATGSTTVTVTLADDGAGCDSGPATITRSFGVSVLPLLPTGYTEPFASLAQWGFAGTYSPSLANFGGSPCLKAVCNNKWYWDGYVLNFDPDLDLTAHPYLSMEVYSESQATLHWLWFYDDAGRRNTNISLGSTAQWAPAGQWTKLLFDFSGYGQMSDSQGDPINAGRITHVLFNVHNQVSAWPLPANYSGTFYVRNIRVGAAADLGAAACALAGIPDQALFAGAGSRPIALTGIAGGSGGAGQVSVSATSSNPALVPHPTVSQVAPDGTATLQLLALSGTGRATVTVVAHATGASDAAQTFTVDLLPADPGWRQTAAVNPAQEYQTIRGFGTYQFPDRPQYVDDYTAGLGASAVRLGLIGNQLEPDNDNGDPRVLNRAALNYGAFDFDHLRRLKAGGVETFILTSWTPPAWMKDNLSEDYQQAAVQSWESADNRLATNYYDEFAESMVAAARVLKEEADIDLYAIGLQNEPAFCEPYGSAILDPAHFVNLLKVAGARFAGDGVATKLYLPEQVFGQGFYSMAQYIDAVQADPAADALCGVIATHGYAEDGVQAGQPDYSQWATMWLNASAPPHPKELWMTETYPEGGTWDQALSLAGAMHGALTAGNVGLWTLWSLEGTLMKGGLRTPSFDAARHFYKFVRPGWKRVGATATHSDLLASAYRSGRDWAVVLINKGAAALAVQVAGTGLPSRFGARLSARDRSFEAVDLVDGALLLPPRAVATLYGNAAFDAWAAGVEWRGRDPSREAIVSPLGVNNLLLYALAIRDPFGGDPAKLPRLFAAAGGGPAAAGNADPRSELVFEFRQNTAAEGLAYRVLASADLRSWSPLAPDGEAVIEEIADPDPDGDGAARLMRYRILVDPADPNWFFCLQITESPGAAWGL